VLACDREAPVEPTSFVISEPVHADPTRMILTGVCPACAERSDDELIEEGYQRMRRLGWVTSKMELTTQ
jgi:hypothetical protein